MVHLLSTPAWLRASPQRTVGMPAQVSKFGENKPFTNRNICFGGRNKLLAAHEAFVSCFKTNLFRGQDGNPLAARNVVKFLPKTKCKKTKLWPPKGLFQAGKQTFLRNLCFPQKTQNKFYQDKFRNYTKTNLFIQGLVG